VSLRVSTERVFPWRCAMSLAGSALRLNLARTSLTSACCLTFTHVALADEPPPAAVTPNAIRQPQPKTTLDAPYPDDAHGDARVELDVSIDKHGAVTAAEVVSGEEPFTTRAKEAARSWSFEPARRGERPVASRIRVSLTFTDPAPLQSTPPAPESGTNLAPAATLPAAPVPAPGAVEQPAEDEAVQVEVRGVRAGGAGVKLTRAEVRELPGAFGDPFRAIEVMPGVTPTSSGKPYFYVRGAPPGNVGYFFDEIPLPVLYHAAIGPAVLHPAFIDSVTLYPGGYSARYGRFAGAVVAGQLAPPMSKFRGEASLRLFDAGGMVELPFAGEQGSVMLGGRYSYSGALVSRISPDIEIGYWDYQSRLTFGSGKHRVGLLAFGGHDELAQHKSDGLLTILDTTFHRADLRYDYTVSGTSAVRFALTYGRDQGVGPSANIRLKADAYRARVSFTSQPSSTVAFRAGADAQLDVFGFSAGRDVDQAALADFIEVGGNHRLQSAGTWLETIWRASPQVTVTPGLRGDVYHEADETKVSIEPRITARYAITRGLSITNSAGIARQPPGLELPTPGYRPKLKGSLQTGIQTSSGVELQLPSEVVLSVSVFQTVLLDGADFGGSEGLANANQLDAQSERSRSHSYGTEITLSRSLTRQLGGFASYTLSRSERKIGDVKGPSGYDRRHVASAALSYDFGGGWRGGARGAFYSGIPVRVGDPKVATDPPRTPPFWRVDTRGEKRWTIGNSGAYLAVVLEVLNATLNDEVVSSRCYAYGCREERLGPITLPSIGVEGAY
jgi:TonB family protein